MTVTTGSGWPGRALAQAVAGGSPPLRAFWLGHLLARLGDWILLVALLVAFAPGAGIGSAVMLLLLARLLPRAIVLTFGAPPIVAPARLLPLLALARAALTLLLIALPLDGLPWSALAVVLAGQAAGAWGETVRDRLLPAAATRAELGPANRLLHLGGQWAFIGGATLGGLLAWRDPRAAFLLAAALFALAAPLARVSAARALSPPRPEDGDGEATLRTGLATVRASAPLRPIVGGSALAMGLATSLLVTLPALLIGRLELPAGTLGPALAAIGLGGALATVPLIRLVSRFSPALLGAGLIVALASIKAALGASPWVPLTALLLIAAGGAAMSHELATAIAVRRLVAASALDAVHRALRWCGTIGQIGGVLVGGLVARFFAWPVALAVAVVAELAALALLLLLGRERPAAATRPADPTMPRPGREEATG